MSSISGDENDIAEKEPVRRTRSGRAVKSKTTPKKTPIKRATRATRAAKTIVESEEELGLNEEAIENALPENGIQQQVIVEEMEITQEISDHLIEESVVEQLTQTEHMEQDKPEENDQFIDNNPDIVSESEPIAPITIIQDENDQKIINDKFVVNQESLVENNSLILTEPTEEKGQDSCHENKSPEESNNVVIKEKCPHIFVEPTMIEKTIKIHETSEMTIPESTEVTTECIENKTESKECRSDASEIIDSKKTNDSIITEDKTNENDGDEDDDIVIIHNHEDDLILKKSEPETESVSEDELPSEQTAKEPETEAVSDEELPTAPPTDLGETEAVSEDELPLESDKRRKGTKFVTKPPVKKPSSNPGSKRKRLIQGEYDPSSPTSENNDETPAKKAAMSAEASAVEKVESKPTSPKKKTLPELDKYWKAVNDDPTDFTGWTYLLQYVDQENDAEAAREAYSKFLERYPYCYGYWRKYADYEKKKGDPEKVQTVFDQGLKAISLSVDLWLHYINHCKCVYEKDEDMMREQYERAIKACGLEFRSDKLWESYIKWEIDNKRLNRAMSIYDRLLATPTLNYTNHFETFQEFVTTNSPNKLLNVDDFLALRSEVKTLLKTDDNATSTDEAPPGEESSSNDTPPTDEETRAIREKIISIRRKIHKATVSAVAARWNFEEGIKRPYFHVKPLERCQLKNWKEYLDYEIEQKDPTRIIILFERCLIACALYDEFWMRFIRYLDSIKGDNTDKIRDVYRRACTVHHQRKPNLHLQWSTFEESHGNYVKAADILENIDNVTPNMLQIAYRRINLERRRGDLDKACTLYEYYINTSKNKTISNNISVKYARFLCKIKNDLDKAIKILLKATEKDKDNPRLYLQLIDLGLQRNPINAEEVVGYMDMFIDRDVADIEQKVLFAQRKVEFLEDFSTDIQQVLTAHDQFQKCIKQAKERKKLKDESKSEAASKKAKVDTSNTGQTQAGAQTYQYSTGTTGTYQSQTQFQSGQYGAQSGYQQSYQQYPPPSDPNYANYQNWQYQQSGQTYAPYNQWGSYNYY